MHLVTGPFRPALESAFRETFAALRRDDPLAPLAVIAPSKRLSDRLKELALEAVPEGIAAVRFFNLFSFARTIYEESAAEGYTLLLDDLVPERLLRAILQRHFADERYLSRALLAPSSLLGALHELKAGGVDPGKALAALAEEELGHEDAPKLAEILSLYKRFEDELRRRRFHERSDVVRLAAEHAPRAKVLGGFKHLLYYGFYDLDQNQLDLLREVRRRVPCTVFFPYLDTPGYAFAKDFLRTVVAPMAESVRDLKDEAPPPRVSQIAASGAHDEVWAAAKEILRFSDQGIPYDQIGVVARTLDPYLDLLESVFKDHKIPYTSSGSRKLARDPRVKAARLLFTLDGFDRADVLDLLRSPFYLEKSGDRELWDQASRLMGIGHGAEEWRRRLGARAGKDYVYDVGARAGARKFVLPRAEVDLFWSAVRPLLDAPAPPGTGWKAYADWALDRYRRFLEPDPRIVDAIGALSSLEGFALEEPRETLLDQLAGLSEPAGGRTGVRVYDAMAARGSTFRALIVIGMNERVFPRFILEDPFVRDAVRSRLEHRLGNRMARKLQGYDEERLLFTLLQGSAEEIIFCHQRSDEQGRLQIPSVFLPPGDPERIARRPSLRLQQAEFELLTPREASLRTGQGEALGRALGWDVSMLVQATTFLREIEKRGPLTPFDGVVDASHYWPSVASFGLSPSALERLAECPFRFFAGRMLDLEELEEPEGESMLTSIETGLVYHDILEQYHRALIKAEGKGIDLGRQLEEGFQRFEKTRSIRYPVLWDAEKEKIEKVLRAFVDADDCSVFRPSDFEVELKAELPFDVGGRKTVTFRGFADRLDLAEDGSFRVIDYKKSKGKYPWIMKTGVFEKGRYLQPPLYFLLAAAMTEGAVATSKFSYYFLEEVLEGEKWEMELSGDMWERKPDFEALFRALLERIPRGEFHIRPDAHCSKCDYQTMCRKSHLPTRLRARDAEDGGEEGE
jgi:ATP-dependent helicase/nuclease subunit B